MRIILDFLRLEDVADLHMTLDIQLQKVVRASITTLQVPCGRHSYQVGYLIRSAVNVHRVTLSRSLSWPAARFSTVRSLNPLELTLHGQYLASSVYNTLMEDPKDMRRAETRSVVENLNPNGFLNFGFLAPRLRSLTLVKLDHSLPPRPIRTNTIYAAFLKQHALSYEMHWPNTLTAFDGTFDHSFDKNIILSLPTTLISLRLRNKRFRKRTVEEIQKSTSIPITTIFTRLTSLENLELCKFYKYEGTATPPSVPKSLTSLRLINSFHFPLQMLNKFDFRSSSLCNLVLEPHKCARSGSTASTFCDLNALLPPSLLSASLIVRGGVTYGCSPVNLSTLPVSLTELKLKLKRNAGDLLSCLSSLTSLTTLTLSAGRETTVSCIPPDGSTTMDVDVSAPTEPTTTYFITRFLPASLQTLEVNHRISSELTKLSVRSLPPNLTKLSVYWLKYDLLETLVSRCPNCQLHFQAELSLTSNFLTAIIENNFLNLWKPTLYINALAESLSIFMTAFRIHIILGGAQKMKVRGITSVVQTSATFPPISPHLKNLALSLFIHPSLPLRKDYPDLKTLSVVNMGTWRLFDRHPDGLTSLELGNTKIVPEGSPNGQKNRIERLSSSYKLFLGSSTPKLPFNNLRYLDAPGWVMTPQRLNDLALDDMEFLRCTVLVVDYKALEYLTCDLPKQTYLVNDLTPLVVPTGALVRDNDDSCMKEVTWTAICDETESTLKRYLARALKLIIPLFLKRDYKCKLESLERMLGSVKVARSALFGSQIVSIPHTATNVCLYSQAVLTNETCYMLSPAWFVSGVLGKALRGRRKSWDHLDALYSVSEGSLSHAQLELNGAFTQPMFGPNLVHLELFRVENAQDVIQQLPTALRFLHIQATSAISSVRFPLGSQLRAIVLESPDDCNFAFDLMHTLPTTVRHLALKSMLRPNTTELSSKQLVPAKLRIETIFLHNYNAGTMTSILEVLDGASLRHMELFLDAPAPGTNWKALSFPQDEDLQKREQCVSRFDVSRFKDLSDLAYDDADEQELVTLNGENEHFFHYWPSAASSSGLISYATTTTTLKVQPMPFLHTKSQH